MTVPSMTPDRIAAIRCTHDLAERETACADGLCALCAVVDIANAQQALSAARAERDRAFDAGLERAAKIADGFVQASVDGAKNAAKGKEWEAEAAEGLSIAAAIRAAKKGTV